MTTETPNSSPRTILIVGASRGLGHAMAAEFAQKSWRVIGTVRGGKRTKLHELADASNGRVEIETLDISEPDQLAALKQRLAGRTLDILFVNAGATDADTTRSVGEVTTQEFTDLMITNALSPMRVIESLHGSVPEGGLIGVMSSGLGSVANNERGQWELYRGTKAALNMFMRSFAARHDETPRAMVAMDPGWVRTDMGGPNATLSIEESVPKLVSVLLAKRGKPGMEYLDYLGRTVPW